MTKGEQARLVAWRLRILQEAATAANVARVCRRFGLSRKSFYKWKKRHAEHGDAGLSDRPHAPHHSPRATAPEVVRISGCFYICAPFGVHPTDRCAPAHALSSRDASSSRVQRQAL